MTTHSPYVLTAINNLIFANDIKTDNGEDKLKGIVDLDCTIKYEDVKAYTMENGNLVGIMDDETRLIGSSVIDSVSDDFDEIFGKLIDIQIGN